MNTATYETILAEWWANLPPEHRAKIEGARLALEQTTGANRKRVKAALRALERELGRP